MKLYKPTYTRNGKTKQSAVWWVRFRCQKREIRRSTECRDKTAAGVRAADIVREEELRAVGVAPPEATKAPLDSLVEEWIQDMERRRLTRKHREQYGGYVRHMLRDLGGLADVTPTILRKRLDELEVADVTRNRYLTAIRTFYKWLGDRWPNNPALKVQHAYAGDPKEKGIFSLADLRALLAAEGIKPYRKRLYLTAATTGLRGAELRRLEDTHVHGDRLEVPGRLAKNKKPIYLPLLPETAEALKGVKGRVFPSFPCRRTWFRDLERAGLSEIDPRGNKRTFHGLRASLATILGESGVPLTVTQAIMRHADPKLTARTYTKHALEVQRAALGSLGGLLAPSPATSRPTASQHFPPSHVPERRKSVPERELVGNARSFHQKKFPPLKPFEAPGVTSRIREHLARCLALLEEAPAAGDPRVEEALRVGAELLHQPRPAGR